MDILIAILVVLLAFWLISALKISLWTILAVVAIVALVVYIKRNSRRI